MKALALAAGVSLLAMSVAVAAVFVAGDTRFLVPPPDAVAESFAREVMEERYELAVRYLSQDLRKHVTGEHLRREFGPLRQELGVLERVEVERGPMGADTGSAHVSITADHGDTRLYVPVVREQGLWVISELPRRVP